MSTTQSSVNSWTVRKALALLKDADPKIRRQAIESLAHHGDMRGVEPVAELLADGDKTVRLAAASALEKLGWANSLRRKVTLAIAIDDYSGVISLGRSVFGLVHEMIPRQPLPVQTRLLEVLGLLADRETLDTIHVYLKHKYLRATAFRALKRFGDPRFAEDLSQFQQSIRSAIQGVRETAPGLFDTGTAKAAVTKLQQILENAADLLPSEMLLQLAPIDRVEALVTINISGDRPAHRTEMQNLRCVAMQKLVLDELTRRGVDPQNAGIQQVAMGNTAYRRQDYAKAMSFYSQAIDINNTFGVAYHNRGCVNGAIEKWDAAIADFNRAVDLNPTESDSLVERGKLYHGLGNFDRAKEDFSTAITMDNNADAWACRGKAYLETGQFEKAVADLRTALDLAPQPDLLNLLGIAYFRSGEFQDAIDSFTRGIELKKSVDLHWNRAIARMCRQQFQLALLDIDRIKSLDPDAAIHNLRGNVLLGLGRAQEAIAEYHLHLSQQKNPITLANLGLALLLRGSVNDAIHCYDQVLAEVPQLAVAWNNRGLAHRMLGHWDQACRDLSKAAELTSQPSTALNNLAMVHHHAGQPAQAMESLNLAVQADEMNAVARRNRCLALVRENRLAEAKEDYFALLGIDPTLDLPR